MVDGRLIHVYICVGSGSGRDNYYCGCDLPKTGKCGEAGAPQCKNCEGLTRATPPSILADDTALEMVAKLICFPVDYPSSAQLVKDLGIELLARIMCKLKPPPPSTDAARGIASSTGVISYVAIKDSFQINNTTAPLYFTTEEKKSRKKQAAESTNDVQFAFSFWLLVDSIDDPNADGLPIFRKGKPTFQLQNVTKSRILIKADVVSNKGRVAFEVQYNAVGAAGVYIGWTSPASFASSRELQEDQQTYSVLVSKDGIQVRLVLCCVWEHFSGWVRGYGRTSNVIELFNF